jgi:hypothetical protein
MDDSDLYDQLAPHHQAVFALSGVIQAVGMLGALVQSMPHLQEAYDERCLQIAEWARNQAYEISIFGQHYDP